MAALAACRERVSISSQRSAISFCERFGSNNHESDVHNYLTIQLFDKTVTLCAL